MQALLTKQQAAEYLGLATPEAAEKLLEKLGVGRINYALIGGKGIRYKKTDLEEALEKIEVQARNAKQKPKARKKKTSESDVFDRPIREQMAIFLTASGPRQ